MADRGIIFSAPMVRALLDGRKSQTRRLLKPQPSAECASFAKVFTQPPFFEARDAAGKSCYPFPDGPHCISPYPRVLYAPGDRLYVREAAWIAPPGWTDSPVNPMGPHRQEVAYAADDRSGYTADAAKDYKLHLRPSIHMPRWASRLWLEVTDVRVQRVRDIDEKDAAAEGVERHPAAPNHLWKSYGHDLNPAATPRESFRCLWNSLHTKPGETWADNPWIVAVSFTVHRGNIDAPTNKGAE